MKASKLLKSLKTVLKFSTKKKVAQKLISNVIQSLYNLYDHYDHYGLYHTSNFKFSLRKDTWNSTISKQFPEYFAGKILSQVTQSTLQVEWNRLGKASVNVIK